MFLFCPKFLPSNLYSAAYVASEYVITLKRELKLKIFVTEQTDANVRFKKRLTLEDISDWWKFREKLETFPSDEIVPVKITELRIKVKGKRIIPENDPPTGLIRTIYDNLVRCKVKNLGPFRDCCETSIYSKMEPKFRHKVTWHMFVQVMVKFLLLLLVPIPFYVRLFIYFQFEADEIRARDAAIKANGLTEKFNLYRTNIIQYFSPVHGVFIATYIFYFLSGLVLGFADHAFREKLKDVARAAIGDMNAVAKTGVLGIIIRVVLYPFKRCGLLGFFVAPIYLPLIAPMCAIVLVLYCIPTVYLTLRLPYHTKKLFGDSVAMAGAAENRRRLVRMHKISKKISKMDRQAHRGGPAAQEESCFPDEWGWGGLSTVKSLLLQLFSSVFCLCILYSIALVFAESTGLFVEVMAFTMMGIIVNAGAVLKYVSMVLLVFVYMNDCYSNVYENYLTFNKTIMDDIIDRTTADIRKIASMPSTQQANTAFQVKCIDEEKDHAPSLNFDKKETRWRLGQLLLFLDCYDTPRIPLRLFQRLCQVQVSGAPGPVYINLLAATGKFMIIVIFLAFVMIVVMAFGNVYQMSSTNTTLATLAGGFVPMLLKNVLNSKGAKLSLKTVSFKGQIDEIIDEYKQFWPVLDLLVERDIPEEDEEKEGEGEDSGEAGEKKDEEKSDGDKDNRKKDIDDVDSKKGGNGSGEEVKEKKVNFKEASEDKGKDSKGDSKQEKDGKGNDSKDKHGTDGNGDADKKSAELKKNGDIISGVGVLHATSLEDEGMVDLFIDLSVADTAGWSIYGSSDSIQSSEDDENIMPSYFDAKKLDTLQVPNNNTDSGRLSVRYKPRQSIIPT
ncbi:ankyrin repeat and socs box protein 2 [Plakobranchus ocellatus]|uniref:Ankyrin repeat and socs box protein 2 n=1 Tax=Plakobranchus ocellatus TaxID=259542 RepID=A0AAV4CJ48_9GAST|nr:ankyrin repeat and socs box protein 2 [Plakobranchus ocellatus]